ncbi:MAG: oligoendopeptidase F [Deltaproteobacteria bacterium]|nr:oligoendopeptidase F [Deltaproteobacteria bacterium]
MTAPCASSRAAIATILLLAGLAGSEAAAADYVPDPNAPRSSVPDAYKWNLTELYASDDAWNEAFEAVEADIPRLEACRGHLADSAQTLKNCLTDTYDVLKRLYQLDTYAGRAFDQDQSVEATKVRAGRVQMLFPRFADQVSFLEPEILSIDKPRLDAFLSESEGVREFSYYLENVQRMKPWTLSMKEERILALAGNVADAPYYAHEALLNVDYRFDEITDESGQKVPLTVTGFTRLRGSTDPQVRSDASRVFFSGLMTHQNTWASFLDGIVKGHTFVQQARGYDSCLQAALTPDNITPAVYTNLIDTIHANLPRTLHRYMTLRKKVLGLPGPVTFDNLYNPMVTTQEEQYTYADAQALILDALQPLGPDYLAAIREGLDPSNGWVDVYPNAKKDSGAYMSGSAYDVHPYVLMNFDNTFDAVSTLAHEYGHAMHSVFTNRNQPFHYADYSTLVAETASTSNEAILLTYMLNRTRDPHTRLWLLNQRLEGIRLTVFRQTMFAEFELRIHEQAEKGEPLTAEFLNGLYGDLVRAYYGPDYAMGPDDVIEWAFIPHFFYNFYVYTYALGLTSGISLAEQIGQRGKAGRAAVERYKKHLLSAGGSQPPLVILRNAGVDLETPDPILDMLDLFERTVAEFDAEWTRLQKKK